MAINLDLLDITLNSLLPVGRSESFTNSIKSNLQKSKLWNKRISNSWHKYYYLYTAPVIEFAMKLGYPALEPDSRESCLFEAHVILALYLRIFDDVVDGDVHGIQRIKASRLSQLLLIKAINKVIDAKATWTDDSQILCNLWIFYEEELANGKTIIFSDLWQRASTLLVIPQLYLSLPLEYCEIYQKYLSILMLVHDIQDLFDDLRYGRRSLPIEILRRCSPDLVLRKKAILMVFDELMPIINRSKKDLVDFGLTNNLKYWNILIGTVSTEFE